MKYKLVQGTKDFLPKSLKEKLQIQYKIVQVFESSGYNSVLTPTLEHHEIFTEGVGIEPMDQLFKLSDIDGSLLVLRSDMTTPISRLVSTKMDANYPLRLCYLGNSFKLKVERNRLREFSQAGVELFGINSAFADAEVIALAIDALLACGLQNFLIDMGQVAILKGILNVTKLSDGQKAQVFSFIDKKNYIDEHFFTQLDNQTRSKLNDITNMFGSAQVLDDAQNILDNQESLQALHNLREVYNILQAMGYEQYISFDLGIVNAYSYYTGVVFKGMTSCLGTPILSGGRYDTLTHSFDKDIPATGFAIGIDNLHIALSREDRGKENIPHKNIVAVGMANSPNAYQAYRDFCKEAIKLGKIINYSYTANPNALKEYATLHKIKEAVFIDANGKVKTVSV